MEIGIFRPGGIGDVVLLLPALHAIRAQFPDVKIHVWGQIDTCAALMWMGYIDSASYHMNGLRFHGSIPDLFVGFEWNPRGLELAARSYGCGAIHTAHWLAPRGKHASKHHFDEISIALEHHLGRGLTSYAMRHSYECAIPPLFSLHSKIWRDTIFIHHGTSLKAKLWQWDKMLDVARLLRRDGHKVALLESPSDNYGDTDDFPVITRPYLDVAFLFMQAKGFVGVDTGNAHLAGALGVPTAVIFGPTQPRTWQPIGPRVKVIQSCDFMAQTDEVLTHTGHDCYQSLTPQRVVDGLYEVMV